MESTTIAGQSALKMSNHNISEIDVAEVHDAFSVCEPMVLESLGICKPRRRNQHDLKNYMKTNNFMINPRGGLIGSGHPLGATGISQTIEIVQQLQKTAGSRQTNNPKTGLVHNMSAAANILNSIGLGKMSFEDRIIQRSILHS